MSPSADISGVFARKRGIAHQQKSGDSTRCTVSTPGPGPAESVGKPRKSLLVVDVIAGDFSFFFFFPVPQQSLSLHAAPLQSRTADVSPVPPPLPKLLSPPSGSMHPPAPFARGVLDRRSERIFFVPSRIIFPVPSRS